MKHIYLNLKRFDVPTEFGGVNRIAPMTEWASYIVKNTQDELKNYDRNEVEFGMYFPELHVLNAVNAKNEGSPIQVGCQSIYRADTAVGGNFGAFTSNRSASSMVAAGCETVIIGHCEERNDKAGILAEAGVKDTDAINRLLNQEIKCAIARGMKVLYCIGEKSEEQEQWEEVLGKQLAIGLQDVDTSKVVIAYEPIWSIGPGKTPAGKDYIIENLIVKEEQKFSTLGEKEREVLTGVFQSQLPTMEKKEFYVQAQAMGENGAPVMITQAEYMRRMKEMASIQAGMSFYGDMPDMYNILVNEEHPLIKRVLSEAETECADKLRPIDEKTTAWENRRKELYDARKEKKEEDIPQSEKDELGEIEKNLTAAKSEKEAILAAYAAGNNTVRQLIDITLLQNNMLTGEALNNFVKRSIDMMK